MKTDELEKFPNTRRVLQLFALENTFLMMERNAGKEAQASQGGWKCREAGRAWGVRFARIEVEEMLDKDR